MPANTTMKRYTSGFGMIYSVLGGLVLVGTTLSAALIAFATVSQGTFRDLWYLPVVVAIAWLVGVYLLNLYPTIWVNNKGLVIARNLVGRLPIAWNDIVAVEKLSRLEGKRGVRVSVTKLPPLYRIYGYNWFRPAFLIAPDTQNLKELLKEIDIRTGLHVDLE